MPQFIPIDEVVKLACLATDDILQRKKGKFLTYAKYIWNEMNLSATKIAVRQLMEVDKRTNSVTLPCDNLKLSSVSVIADDGSIYQVFRNDKIHDDIVDVAGHNHASCGCGSKLCNMIKGYEAITEIITEKMPNGTSKDFTCVTRKGFVGDTFYEEKQYPIRIYTDGTWTDVALTTDKTELCKVDVFTDENGTHIKDTLDNFQLICDFIKVPLRDVAGLPIGGTNDIYQLYNEWIFDKAVPTNDPLTNAVSYCSIDYRIGNFYNITETGDRILFPQHFGHKKVLIRYFADVSLKDLRIPFIAVPTFVTGLKWYDTRWDDKKQNLSLNYEREFSKQMWGLGLELSKCTVKELSEAFVNHYRYPRHNRSQSKGGGYAG